MPPMTIISDNLKVFQGKLSLFSDQWSEGEVWCLQDPSKPGYAGLEVIESGDLLTVFADAGRRDIMWEGTVSLDFGSHRKPLPLAGNLVQRLGGMTVHGVPTNVKPLDWMAMFQQHKPCLLVRHQTLRPF